jgi:hypothetical protein
MRRDRLLENFRGNAYYLFRGIFSDQRCRSFQRQREKA